MTRLDAYAAIVDAEELFVERLPDDADRFRMRYEGDRYYVLTYADDPSYFGISATYTIPKGTSRAAAMRVANDCTKRTKVVKSYVIPGRAIVFAAELFLDDAESLRPVLIRLLRVLQSAAASSFEALREAAKSAA